MVHAQRIFFLEMHERLDRLAKGERSPTNELAHNMRNKEPFSSFPQCAQFVLGLRSLVTAHRSYISHIRIEYVACNE